MYYIKKKNQRTILLVGAVLRRLVGRTATYVLLLMSHGEMYCIVSMVEHLVWFLLKFIIIDHDVIINLEMCFINTFYWNDMIQNNKI